MADRHERSQLVGDAVRDAGVLIAVFYPLDVLVESQFKSVPIDWSLIVLSWVISGCLFWWGIILEGRDEL